MLKEAERNPKSFKGLKVGEITLIATMFAQNWMKTWTNVSTILRHKYRSLTVSNSIYWQQADKQRWAESFLGCAYLFILIARHSKVTIPLTQDLQLSVSN